MQFEFPNEILMREGRRMGCDIRGEHLSPTMAEWDTTVGRVIPL